MYEFAITIPLRQVTGLYYLKILFWLQIFNCFFEQR